MRKLRLNFNKMQCWNENSPTKFKWNLLKHVFVLITSTISLSDDPIRAAKFNQFAFIFTRRLHETRLPNFQLVITTLTQSAFEIGWARCSFLKRFSLREGRKSLNRQFCTTFKIPISSRSAFSWILAVFELHHRNTFSCFFIPRKLNLNLWEIPSGREIMTRNRGF